MKKFLKILLPLTFLNNYCAEVAKKSINARDEARNMFNAIRYNIHVGNFDRETLEILSKLSRQDDHLVAKYFSCHTLGRFGLQKLFQFYNRKRMPLILRIPEEIQSARKPLPLMLKMLEEPSIAQPIINNFKKCLETFQAFTADDWVKMPEQYLRFTTMFNNRLIQNTFEDKVSPKEYFKFRNAEITFWLGKLLISSNTKQAKEYLQQTIDSCVQPYKLEAEKSLEEIEEESKAMDEIEISDVEEDIDID